MNKRMRGEEASIPTQIKTETGLAVFRRRKKKTAPQWRWSIFIKQQGTANYLM